MKKILFAIPMLFVLASCEKDNTEECEALYIEYVNALKNNTGTSEAAVKEVQRQVEKKRKKLGCDWSVY